MNDKIQLKLVGITYNQIESGVYALILQQEDGTRRIPIIIGYAEAQAIECKLQEVITPRPLTHDLMVSLLENFGLTLHEVLIYKLESGIFAADLVISDSKGRRVIDSRSSDAIALAIRVGAPIYTTRQVLEEAGFEPDEKPKQQRTDSSTVSTTRAPRRQFSSQPSNDITLLSDQQLAERLDIAIADERYEEAARIKSELDRRKK
ncbi:MAG: bifunctional nuclease family protein [Muribaculaceae bacterium]|nr:bifunctional nuclease family protein [Muribaculaceae bacterium]